MCITSQTKDIWYKAEEENKERKAPVNKRRNRSTIKEFKYGMSNIKYILKLLEVSR